MTKVLQDSVDIRAPYEAVRDFFFHLDETFVSWSPDHREFERVSGGMGVGDTVRFRETVAGVDYDVTGKILELEDDGGRFFIKFHSKYAWISFEGRTNPDGTVRFTHIESFGKEGGVGARIINWLIFSVLGRKKANWDLILRDMVEDNRLLKERLEGEQRA